MDTEAAAPEPPRLWTVDFRNETVEAIAVTLGVEVALAPFQLPGGAVYQLTIAGQEGKPSALVTLWPSLRRVDAIGGGAAVVFTRVVSAQLVTGVEVLFRRESGEYLIVTKAGKVIVRS